MPACANKWLMILPALATGVSLGGCTSVEGFPRRPETLQMIESQRARFFGAQAEQEYHRAQNEDERRRLRDQLVYGKMEVIEYDFESLERALNSTGNTVGLAGDLSVLTLTGIAATTGGEATKSALAALSSGIVGAQGAISKNLYFQRTLPALLAQMEANRARVRATIIASLIRKTDAEYPLAAAVIDLRQLIRAGSIPSSITQITQQAALAKEDAQAIVDSLRDVSFSDTASSKTLAAWVRPGGTIDPARIAALQAWMNARPEQFLRSVQILDFIRASDPRLEPLRQEALQDPSLAITR